MRCCRSGSQRCEGECDSPGLHHDRRRVLGSCESRQSRPGGKNHCEATRGPARHAGGYHSSDAVSRVRRCGVDHGSDIARRWRADARAIHKILTWKFCMAAADAQKVTEVTHWDENLFSFRVARPASLRFRSGEFVMLGLPGDNGKPLLRAYSIAAPSWAD